MSNLAGRLKQLPSAAAFLVVGGLLACVAVYWTNYQQRERYLTDRNFRLLSVLATQAEGVISDTSKRLEAGKWKVEPKWLDQDVHAILFDRTKRYPADKLDPPEDKSSRLDGLLGRVFTQQIGQGAFDTLVFATPKGKVAFATGRRGRELQATVLEALLAESRVAPSSDAKGPPAFSERYSRRVTVQDAEIAGVAYRMFIQPCCQVVKGAPPGEQTDGAIVVGLVASGALRSEAMAISPTLVVGASLLVMLAGLAWPFLNVAFRGPRQPVKVRDALQLGFSANIGLAIATIIALTSVQCARLEHDLEVQLESLAAEIDGKLTEEIGRGVTLSRNLENLFWPCDKTGGHPSMKVTHETPCKPLPATSAAKLDSSAVIDKDIDKDIVFALVNNDGRQAIKAWPAVDASGEPRRPPSLLSVADRGYFKAVKGVKQVVTGHAVDCTGRPCALESLVSWTTGEPSAVLARPTGIPDFPVATLTTAMRSVINPILPPGFAFAIIDSGGNVVFHSDVQRNNHENLFLETDGNRELRSLVGSGIDGLVRTDYWGRRHHGYVRHAQVYGWSIVTLFDLRNIRGLMVEWTVVSLLLLSAYAAFWLAAMWVALANGASWIWPDRFRRWRYGVLAWVYAVLLAGFGVVYWQGDSLAVGQAGFVVPLLAWVITFLVLRQRPAATADAASLEARFDYCVVGALFLAVSGILPGVAFVARSYDSNMEGYVKHRQRDVVQAMTGRPGAVGALKRCLPPNSGVQDTASSESLKGPVVYSEFIGGTTVCSGKSAEGDSEEVHHASVGGDPLEWLEAYLPYYSEASVMIRELTHRNADDCSWTSERRDDKLILNVRHEWASSAKAAKSCPQAEVVTVTTTMPRLAAIGPSANKHSTASMAVGPPSVLAALFLGLIALGYAIAVFMWRYVFLGHVNPPLWALGRLAIPEGNTVILVCDPARMEPYIDGALKLELGPMLLAGDPDDALAKALAEKQPDKRPILVTDLDTGGGGLQGVADKARLLGSLIGSHAHTVIALSKRPLPELAEALANSWPTSLDATAVKSLEKAGRLTVLDWRARPETADGPLTISTVPPPREWWRSVLLLIHPPNLRSNESLLWAEERANLRLRSVCESVRNLDEFKAGRLTSAEVLEEIDEAAEELYTELWNGCSDDEKLELRHIAKSGLANAENPRAVRGLIAKRLVTKDPELRLMNQTFRRFVLSSRRPGHVTHVDVTRIEEGLAASPWDRFRMLFALAAVLVFAFLFTTQRDMFNTTVAAMAGVSAAVPTLLRLFSLVAEKNTRSAADQQNT